MRVGIPDTAAADDERILGLLQDLRSALELGGRGHAPVHMPDALSEEGNRIIIRFAFHILRHRQAHRAGIGGIGEHAHGMDRGRHQLFGALDAVKIMAYATECIRHGLAEGLEELRLLQHRVRLAAGKGIARQHQQRNAVGRGTAAGSHHIHGAGADGRHARDDFQAVLLLGKRRGSQRHILFILALQEADAVPALLERLSDADHAAVAENTEHIVDKLVFHTVKLHPLVVQEPDEGLRHGQTNGLHVVLPPDYLGSPQ